MPGDFTKFSSHSNIIKSGAFTKIYSFKLYNVTLMKYSQLFNILSALGLTKNTDEII